MCVDQRHQQQWVCDFDNTVKTAVLTCDITCMCGRADAAVNPLGWKCRTKGTFEQFSFPGTEVAVFLF